MAGIHCYPELAPGQSIEDLVASQEDGERTIESQDNPQSDDWGSLRDDKRKAESCWFRNQRKEGIKHKRKYSLSRR